MSITYFSGGNTQASWRISGVNREYPSYKIQAEFLLMGLINPPEKPDQHSSIFKENQVRGTRAYGERLCESNMLFLPIVGNNLLGPRSGTSIDEYIR